MFGQFDSIIIHQIVLHLYLPCTMLEIDELVPGCPAEAEEEEELVVAPTICVSVLINFSRRFSSSAAFVSAASVSSFFICRSNSFIFLLNSPFLASTYSRIASLSNRYPSLLKESG